MFTVKIPVQRNILAASLCSALLLPGIASGLEKKDVAGFWAIKLEDSSYVATIETRFLADNSYEQRLFEVWDGIDTFRVNVFGTWTIKANSLIVTEDGNRCRQEESGFAPENCIDIYVDTFALVLEGNRRTLVYDEDEFDGPLGDFIAADKAFTLPSLFASTRILPGAARNGRLSAGGPAFGMRRSLDSRTASAFDATGRRLAVPYPAVPVLLIPEASLPEHRPSLAKSSAGNRPAAKRSRRR